MHFTLKKAVTYYDECETKEYFVTSSRDSSASSSEVRSQVRSPVILISAP